MIQARVRLSLYLTSLFLVVALMAPGCWGPGNTEYASDWSAVTSTTSCTTCICAYGGCHYDSDCPGSATCSGSNGTCSDASGNTVDNIFKKECDEWIKQQSDCDKTSVESIKQSSGYDSQGCDDVRVEEKGHSSSNQCQPYLDRVFHLCSQGCSVTACNEGCNTFTNQQNAEQYFQTCVQNAKAAGHTVDVSVTGNQSLSCVGRETHMTMECESGPPTTSYDPCDWDRDCFFIDSTIKCEDNGTVKDAICCPDSGGEDPEWSEGTSCPALPCDELDNGTCWGNQPPPTESCVDGDGNTQTYECCESDGTTVEWIEHGTWEPSCNAHPHCDFGASCGTEGDSETCNDSGTSATRECINGKWTPPAPPNNCNHFGGAGGDTEWYCASGYCGDDPYECMTSCGPYANGVNCGSSWPCDPATTWCGTECNVCWPKNN